MRHLFYKSFLGKFYNHVGHRILVFVGVLAKKTNDKKILDIGAGDCQYKKYFENAEYKSQDVCDKDQDYSYSQIDIRSEIYSIPVKNESFDFILCTQVLEHLRYPENAFKEFSRILKGGGELWLTCPLCWEEHEIPFDYFRFTRYALKTLSENYGFEVVSIVPQGGRFIMLGKMIKDLFPGMIQNQYLYYFVLIIQAPLILIILFFLYCLDFFDRDKSLTLQYECIFKKK